MRKFLKKICIMIICILIFFTGMFLINYLVVGSQYTNSYQAAFVDKLERLNSIDEPKIILVGHSNLAFGMNSEELQKEFGMPVVNLGLHGGLGNVFYEEAAKKNINKGDIVVICNSSYADDGNIYDPDLAWITIDCNKSMYGIFSIKDWIRLFPAYNNYWWDSFKMWITKTGNRYEDGCYARNAFNECGDVIVRPDSLQMDVEDYFSQMQIAAPEVNDICTKRLNRLNDYCTNRGAKMVVAGFPIAYGAYSVYDEKDFEDFQAKLEESLDCEVISDFRDYFYPYDYFYNTYLHLNEKGAQARTTQLISDLKKWMSGQEQ